jgi:antitoxin ParD1/3/4/toxin ParE1/3/4
VNRRFILAPRRRRDLVQIWRHIKSESSRETADRVESAIRGNFIYLADFPHAGPRRRDLTDAPVRFFSVYSYLVVYRPETRPLQIVSVLHGGRNVEAILSQRL